MNLNINKNIFFTFNLDNSQAPYYLIGILYISINEQYVEYLEDNHKDNFSNNPIKKFIYGKFSNGQKFTLENCRHSTSSSYMSGSKNSKFIFEKLYVGDWIIKEVKVKSAKINLSYLYSWLDLKDLDFGKQKFYEDNEKETLSLLFTNQKYRKFNIDQNTSFQFVKRFEISSDLYNNSNLNSDCFIKLIFKNSILITDFYIEYLEALKLFFKLALKTDDIFVEKLRITTNKAEFDLGKDYHYKVKFCQKNYHLENKSFNAMDNLYYYDDNLTENVLQNFFLIKTKYKKLVYSLNGIIHNKDNYVENQFLSSIQWIEGFIRISYPISESIKILHHKRIENILQYIKDDNDKELISKGLEYQYEPTLRKKLKTLFYDYNLNALLGLNKELKNSLIDKIVFYRNQLTHISDKTLNKDDLQMLSYTSNFLENIIYIIMSKKLLFNNNNSRGYNELINRLSFSLNSYIIPNLTK